MHLLTHTVKKINLALGVALLVLLTAPATASDPGGFELNAPSVRPGTAYFAGQPLTIRFTAADARERRTRVVIVSKRRRETVRHWRLATPAALTRFRLRWNGLNDDGGVARDGPYTVRAAPAGHPTRLLGAFAFRRHAYPIAGPHADRGYWGEFGAPREGGRRHQGFDVNAACGTPVVAARGGKVLKSKRDPKLMGNFVVIRGHRDRFRFLYAHLRDPSPMHKGDRIRTAQLVGYVGRTGNADGTPCHLHIELRDDGPVDPEPYLDIWDR